MMKKNNIELLFDLVKNMAKASREVASEELSNGDFVLPVSSFEPDEYYIGFIDALICIDSMIRAFSRIVENTESEHYKHLSVLGLTCILTAEKVIAACSDKATETIITPTVATMAHEQANI